MTFLFVQEKTVRSFLDWLSRSEENEKEARFSELGPNDAQQPSRVFDQFATAYARVLQGEWDSEKRVKSRVRKDGSFAEVATRRFKTPVQRQRSHRALATVAFLLMNGLRGESLRKVCCMAVYHLFI